VLVVMNNTRTLAILAVLAATLVVGTLAVTTTTVATQSIAFAYPQKKGADKKDGGNNNGNTITIKKLKVSLLHFSQEMTFI
jgi:hypothetical protein